MLPVLGSGASCERLTLSIAFDRDPGAQPGRPHSVLRAGAARDPDLADDRVAERVIRARTFPGYISCERWLSFRDE
jgi:hypothetical protein